MVTAGLALIIAAALAWRMDWPARTGNAQPDSTQPEEALSLAEAAMKGADSAGIVLIEYADFECAFCKRFAISILPTLEKEYIATGSVKFVYRHLPLSEIHSQALPAARAAECARRLGKFWEMHDFLFENQAQLSESTYRTAAAALGFANGPFEACLAAEGARAIESDLGAAKRLNIASTPTFFVGVVTERGDVRVTSTLRGSPGLDVFRQTLDRALQSRAPAR